MLNNSQFSFQSPTGMLSNPFNAIPQTTVVPNIPQQVNLLNLTQIEGFHPVQKFTDDTNTVWTLVKAFSDSTVDVPDPKSMQIVDYWDHKFVGLKTDVPLYVYVVEGVRQPRVETEQPSRIMFQWFSKVYVKDFTPQMISEREWYKANVYAAPVLNARVSKLNAICKVKGGQSVSSEPQEEDKLIRMDELNGTGTVGRDKKQD